MVARRHVAAACEGLSRDLVEVTLLLTSEVVTHAVASGGADIRLSLDQQERWLRVEVEGGPTGGADGAAAAPPADSPAM